MTSGIRQIRATQVVWPALAIGAAVAAGLRFGWGKGVERRSGRRIPRDHGPDSTLALLREGYEFIPNRCRRYDSDLFQTRLMLQRTICMQGEEAARLFYNPMRFHRHGAAPRRLKKTLFGDGGVQGLDGEAHRHRKELFMSLMTPERIGTLAQLTETEWKKALERWASKEEIVLFDEVRELLCRSVCTWSGVPLEKSEARQRADEFEAMIDSPGRIGPRHLQGRRARRSSERWITDIIEKVRSGELEPQPQQALHAISWHRDPRGRLLDPQVAAVELINILRPTVAISRYILYLALALHERPEFQERLASGEDDLTEFFVQEVRRLSPFFPFVAARVSETFTWKGYRFPKHTRVLLDLYGTCRDPRTWEDPEAFRPERFRNWNGSPFNFIPQGGGEHTTGHRCAGEWVTIELMKVSLAFLTRSMRYEVPEQNLRVRMSRMPAIPQSHFIIRNVRSV